MKKSKNKKIRVAVCLILFLVALLLDKLIFKDSIPEFAYIIVYAVIYLVAGYDVLWKSLKNIRRGKIFDENFLMAVASLGAFAIREYSEACAVMIFYLIGDI